MEAASQASADLLRVSAFLSPDAIPYELFEAGASEMGDALAAALGEMAEDPAAFAEVLAPLTQYSLVRAEPTLQAYSVARMVQEVQQAALTEAERRVWAVRSIEAVWQAFPAVEYKNWPRIERLLPHGRLAAQLVSGYQVEAKAAASLLNETALYLYYRGLYEDVEPLYEEALEISKRTLGEDHPDVATRLNNLALLYSDQGRYSEAEPLYEQALEISKRSLGEDHPAVATSLNNLALLYQEQGRYSDAEPLYQEAIAIGKRTLGEDHPAVATRLNNLALLYQEQGRYSEAESFSRQCLAIFEKALGAAHPSCETARNNLQGILAQIDKEKGSA
ncbi:MAG: tetratricopeptide repeat protein [Cyanobacteria bacterium P01_A01_bin.116]